MERDIALESYSYTPAVGKSVKIRLMLSAIVLFLLTFGVCAFFTLATFDKIYSQAIVDRYALLSERLHGDLEKSICPSPTKAARPGCIHNVQGQDITEFLTDFQFRFSKFAEDLKNEQANSKDTSAAVVVSVASLEGTVLYSSEQQLVGRTLPKLAEDTISHAVDAATYAKQRGVYSITLPLHGKDAKQIATLTVELDESLIKLSVNKLLERHTIILMAVFLGCLAVLVFLLSRALPGTLQGNALSKKKITTIILAVVCAAQLLSSVGGAFVFEENYLQFSAIHNDFYGKLLSIGLDVLITVVISILCLVELIILVFKYLEKCQKFPADDARPKTVHYSVMRPTIFLFLFGVDISAALIPLQMEQLYEPMLGLPKDFVMALPVTALFFSVGITFLIAGAWMDRRGWHEPFLTGVVLAGVAKFYAWLAPDALQFIIAMGGVGFGYGLALMAAQGFVMANTADKDKAHGIAYFFAGVYAGSIGGIAIGAMLAERIGYNLIFLIGALCIFASFGYTMAFLRNAFQRPDQDATNKPASAGKKGRFIRFLLDRNVLSLVFFCSVPAAIAVIGFLNYFSPIYLNRHGVSESLIGGVLMLYGISMVYISPLISKRIDATNRKDHFIAIGCALGSCAFLSFYFLSGLAATITAVLLLGLSGSCLQSSQTAYALKLRATQELGTGKAIAIVRATSRVGQMLGPIIFSWFVMANDTEEAITYFGLVYLLVAFLFMTFTKRESSTTVRDSVKRGPTELSEAHS